MIYTISYVIFHYLMKIVFCGEGLGTDNFPRKGPFIAVFNHNSNFDVLTLSLAAKFRAMGMGKYELFKVPGLRWWLKKINVYPIIRGTSDVAGFEIIEKKLRQGEILFISPEGTRKWENGVPPRPRLGFVRLAQSVECPVVPVAISGTRDILPPGAFLPKWRKIVVSVGKPVSLVPIESKIENRGLLQQQANEVMRKVYELLPPNLRPNSPILKQGFGKQISLLLLYEE